MLMFMMSLHAKHVHASSSKTNLSNVLNRKAFALLNESMVVGVENQKGFVANQAVDIDNI